MKKYVAILGAWVLCIHAVAQDSIPSISEKKLYYGFQLGWNQTVLHSTAAAQTNNQFALGQGVRLGLHLNYQFHKNVSFQPKAELSFSDARQTITDSEAQIFFSDAIYPVSFQFMGHFVLRCPAKTWKPFVLAGPNYRVPLTDKRDIEGNYGYNKALGLDVGIGVERHFKNFILAPEIRYGYSNQDINRSPILPSMSVRQLSFLISLRG